MNASVHSELAMVEFALFQIFLHTICEIAPDLRKEQLYESNRKILREDILLPP